MLIVDTGPLVAAAVTDDPDHDSCQVPLEEDPGPLHTTAMAGAPHGGQQIG